MANPTRPWWQATTTLASLSARKDRCGFRGGGGGRGREEPSIGERASGGQGRWWVPVDTVGAAGRGCGGQP